MFRAFDPDSDRLVAIKVFTLDLAPERVHHVVAELERVLAASLSHPSIASPLAAGIHDNHPYLVMEYASADSLDIALRHGSATPRDAVRVAAQLASALDCAAVDDIAHGALHPRDILLTPEDTRLTGLGIARAFERVDVPAPIRRPYTSPECIAGTAWDRRADVYSLAAVLHELIWGRRLSAMGAQAADSLTAIDGGDLDALRALFARALAEDPSERFETAFEFAAGLKQAFPEVVLASPRPKRTAPRAAALVEPRLPLDEPEPDLRVPSFAVRDLDGPELDEPVIASLPPTPVEIGMHPEPEPPRFVTVDPTPSEPELAEVVADFAPVTGAAPAPPEHEDASVPAGLLNTPSDVTALALEHGRSDIWPLALALVVGAAIGFGGGYFFANYERGAAPETVAAADTPAAQPAGREWTESTVAPATSTPAPVTTPPAASAPAPSTPAPAPAAAAAGRLLVRSTPAGARVFVDGREEGRTPLTIDALERGVHRVRVVREGYATAERRVTITAARPSQSMTVPLTRARQAPAAQPVAASPSGAASQGNGSAASASSGRLTVITRPAGAKVFVDDKLAGTTPLQLPAVAAGSHAVRLELDGYRRWSSSVNIAAGENRVTASLER